MHLREERREQRIVGDVRLVEDRRHTEQGRSAAAHSKSVGTASRSWLFSRDMDAITSEPANPDWSRLPHPYQAERRDRRLRRHSEIDD